MKTLARIALACALAVISAAPPAVDAQTLAQFDLPSQSMAASLRAVGSRTGTNVLFDPTLVEGLHAPALRVQPPLERVFARLLAGSGLKSRFLDEKTVMVVAAEPRAQVSPARTAPAGFIRLAQADIGVSAPRTRLAAAAPAAAAAEPPRPAEGLTEIVVTGTRIARGGEAAPTPTLALNSEDIQASGAVSPGDVVRQLPALAPGLNSESSGVTFNAAGLDLLDLRGLGTDRTLTLINGRRQVSSNPSTSSVDLNTIPTPLIERVEVITGGASAVYGADAVAGVVNIILKRDFEGLQLDAQYGSSSRGDADRYAISLLAGSNFADRRGNVIAFAGYTQEDGADFDSRPGGVSGRNWIPNPANTGPNDGIADFIIVDNVRQLGGQRESMFLLDRGNGSEAFAFNPDGSVRAFGLGPSGLIGGGQFTDGGEAELGFDSVCPQAKCPVRVPVERFLLSTGANYELNDHADLFFEGRYASTRSEARIGSVFEIPPFTNSLSIDNPFVSPSLRALMQQANVTSVGIVRSDQELGLRGQDAERRTLQLVGGVRGGLGLGDFRYDASVQYGSTDFTNTRVNDLYQQRWFNALDAIRDTDGVIKCRSEAARAEGCVPLNLFRPGAALTPEVLKYVEIPHHSETARIQQTVASANLTGTVGDPFGAGAISLAVGTEYRKEESDYLTSPIDQFGQGFFFVKRDSTTGEYDVFEYYGEVLVPLLRDRPFAQRLEIEGAVRRSDYSTAGETTSWKGGLSWAPVVDLRFRSTLARAVRAPNIGELFSVGTEGFITVDDPCDVANITGGSGSRAANCAALGIAPGFISNARTINIRTTFGGNPDLVVEEADTLTLGAVFIPSFVPGLTATIDYFKIEIEDAVNALGTQDILNNCVDLGSISNPFCGSVARDSVGNILNVSSQNINVSRLDREGVELEVRYVRPLGIGRLNLDLAATRMSKVDTIVAPGTLTGGAVIDQNGEFGFPKWKARLGAGYDFEPFQLSGTLTYFSNMIRDNQPSLPEDNRASAGTGNHILVNLQGAYDFNRKTRVYLGIDNVFDKLPPSLPDTRMGGASSTDGAEIFPALGRYLYSGVTVGF